MCLQILHFFASTIATCIWCGITHLFLPYYNLVIDLKIRRICQPINSAHTRAYSSRSSLHVYMYAYMYMCSQQAHARYITMCIYAYTYMYLHRSWCSNSHRSHTISSHSDNNTFTNTLLQPGSKSNNSHISYYVQTTLFTPLVTWMESIAVTSKCYLQTTVQAYYNAFPHVLTSGYYRVYSYLTGLYSALLSSFIVHYNMYMYMYSVGVYYTVFAGISPYDLHTENE